MHHFSVTVHISQKNILFALVAYIFFKDCSYKLVVCCCLMHLFQRLFLEACRVLLFNASFSKIVLENFRGSFFLESKWTWIYLCHSCVTYARHKYSLSGNQNYLISPIPRIPKPPIHFMKGLGMI